MAHLDSGNRSPFKSLEGKKRAYSNSAWEQGLENSGRKDFQGRAIPSQHLRVGPILSIQSFLSIFILFTVVPASSGQPRAAFLSSTSLVTSAPFCFNFPPPSRGLTLPTRETITTKNLFEPNNKVTSVCATYGLSALESWVMSPSQSNRLGQRACSSAQGPLGSRSCQRRIFPRKEKCGQGGQWATSPAHSVIIYAVLTKSWAKSGAHNKVKPTTVGGKGHSPSSATPLTPCWSYSEYKDENKNTVLSFPGL